MKFIIITLIIIVSFNLLADEESEENEQFGEKKAITAIKNEGEEFKLSAESFHTLGIVLADINIESGPNQVRILKSSLVKYMNIHGVYINRKGWFKFFKIKILKDVGRSYVASIPGIQIGDKIVIKSVGLIRVAHTHALGALRGVDLD